MTPLADAPSVSVPVRAGTPPAGTVRGTPHVSRIQPPYRTIGEIAPEYSRLPIADGFNWDEAFADVARGEWYLVVFRSKHRADADHAYLTELDERASHAASLHPGFLYYFIGTPVTDGSCLSFCLWHSRADAIAAAADPAHREAMVKGLPFFAHYQLERYCLRKEHGDLTILPLPAPAATGSPATPPLMTACAVAG